METLLKSRARKIWMHAQGLDRTAPFGSGVAAVPAAIAHLGYVQIDTINVIERCHHHILYNRIPHYQRAHLHQSQTLDKTVFEYWTHALSYVPTQDFRFFIGAMKRRKIDPGRWFESVKPAELRKVLGLVKAAGPLSIRDIDDEVRVEKTHPWASTKPSKKALQLAFHTGQLVISERQGMLKKYELTGRHFAWPSRPKAASPREVLDYLLDRALRAQGLVSLDSICHLVPSQKPSILKVIEKRVRAGELIPVRVRDFEKVPHWMAPQSLEFPEMTTELVHILSPFDPLVIQRKRLLNFFDYEHRFEAYLPKEKRVYGYFALPVLVGDRVVAALDLKTDRQAGRLRVQKWTWIGKNKSPTNKHKIDDELERFEKFQLSVNERFG